MDSIKAPSAGAQEVDWYLNVRDVGHLSIFPSPIITNEWCWKQSSQLRTISPIKSSDLDVKLLENSPVVVIRACKNTPCQQSVSAHPTQYEYNLPAA